ncbi:hypothetical protein ACH5RR_032674 [Cinchona calisaya]|uniref:Uncharacterized protein n=1 Tax=Cinchona calisaya TaxID=153742 RepID=A0ABD2YLX4_9GENT
MAAVGLVGDMEGLLRKAFSFTSVGEFSGMAARFGVEVHLRSLITSLETFHAFLSDAETKVDSSIYLKLWLEEVNRVTAMADDLLDGFAYEVGQLKAEELKQLKKNKWNKVCNLFTSVSISFSLKRVEMIRRLKVVNSRFRNLSDGASLGLERMGLDVSVQFDRIRNTTDFSVVELELLGEDSLILKQVLLNAGNDGDLFFVSIVGMGGIGKTTLAKVVFNDSEVVNHFDERMWINVSDVFDVHRLLKYMFQSLAHTVLDMYSTEAIALKLLERLKGKKYLLVLDNVWNENLELWNLFTNCLLKLGGSRGSKIMLTTRIATIADNLLVPCFRHNLSFQPDEYSWKLFQQIAFAPGGPEKTPRLLEVGKTIVQKCGGHPLAIKLVGRLLFYEKDERNWLKMVESIERRDIPGLDAIIGILKLSYDHLPSKSLKQCFLYCSVFQKDSIMEKDELIQLWMAQGLLNPPRGSDLSMEDLGAQYLDFFVRTSLLQNAEQDDDEFDRRKSYRMHDLLHDCALFLSKDYCSIMDGMNIPINGFQDVHISLINCQVEISESSGNNYKKLRTLRWVNSSGLGDMLTYTILLRVLIVVDLLVEELPASVSKLKLLHYLDVSKTKILKLPDSISKLYNLQTLKLYDLLEFPKNFENLVNLRHLYIESFKDLDKLSSLPPRFQELVDTSAFKASFKAYLHKNCPIGKLHMLLEHPDRYSTLRIYRLENVSDKEEASKAMLSSMSTIDCLQLHWNARREDCNDKEVLEGLQPHPNIKRLIIENYKGYAFPSWMVSMSGPLILRHLVKMELENCSRCEQVPPLGHLPYLKIVKILGMVNVKRIGAEFYGLKNLDDQSSCSTSAWAVPTVFPALRELTLREMTCLEKWFKPLNPSNQSLSVCPLLEKFEVEQCPKLIHHSFTRYY